MGSARVTASASGADAWAFLAEGFVAPSVARPLPRWTEAEPLLVAHKSLMAARCRELEHELAACAFDADEPLRQNWHSFRALVLGKEETWSDWLAFLIATGEGQFISELFALRGLPASRPRVRRETVVPVSSEPNTGSYRSDVQIEWNERAIHLEVKTGDSCLEKTWGEARLLRDTHPGIDWDHFMLLLPEQTAAFTHEAAVTAHADAPVVKPLTWHDVSRALRAALTRRTSGAVWLGLARAFTGAIEQLLLRRPVLGPGGSVPSWWSPTLEHGQVEQARGDDHG